MNTDRMAPTGELTLWEILMQNVLHFVPVVSRESYKRKDRNNQEHYIW